jgi:hypothetical protein
MVSQSLAAKLRYLHRLHVAAGGVRSCRVLRLLVSIDPDQTRLRDERSRAHQAVCLRWRDWNPLPDNRLPRWRSGPEVATGTEGV